MTDRIQIVLFAINETYFDRTIAGLLAQSHIKERVRLIFVDAANTDTAKERFCELEKTFRCEYVDAEGSIPTGLSKAAAIMDDAPFVLCLSGTVYSDKALSAMAAKAEQGYSVAGIHPYYVAHLTSRLAGSLVNKVTDYLKFDAGEGYVKFAEYVESMHRSLDSYMFGSEYVRYVREFRAADDDCLSLLLFDLLSRSEGYYYIPEEKAVMYSPQQITNSEYSAPRQKWWYTEHLNGSIAPFIDRMKREDRLSSAMQYSLTELILSRFLRNFEEKNLGVFADKNEIIEIFKAAGKVLGEFSSEIILRWCDHNRWTGRGQDRKIRFHRALAIRLLEYRAEQCGGKLEVSCDDEYLYVTSPGEEPVKVCQADQETLDVTVMNYENGNITVDAVFSAGDILGNSFELWAECDGKRIDVQRSTVYPLIKCFGETAARRQPVKLTFSADAGTNLRFYYCVGNGIRHQLKLTFNYAFSRLVSDKPKSYWVFTRGRYLCCCNSRVLQVRKINSFTRFFKEIGTLISMFSYQCPGKVMLLGSIAVRCLYWLTRPFFGRKKRWVTFDKLYKGGDNGEYFFRYSAGRKDKVRVYYIVNKDTREYRELKKKYKYVLKAISLRTVLTVLNSEAIAATHSTVVSYLGIPLSSRPFLRDLFNFKVCCIQHGLTVQQLAQYQNRTFDNTTLYCLASPYEYANLMKPMYDFEDRHLKMTGLARFDGLQNDDRRFILITPTWRRNVVQGGIANIKKEHSSGFKDTEYYRLYNTLINDEKLIECARRCGYGITYLLHPAMSAQIDDYDRNDYVELVPATGDMNYEQILTQASLMVTDYSGVQFDFAYMRKPIVYYHPDTLPPQYESGSIDYETTGFGPICTRHEQLVENLCRLMENDCRNTDTYIERANSFFAFSDYESCRRIYEEMLAFTDNREIQHDNDN